MANSDPEIKYKDPEGMASHYFTHSWHFVINKTLEPGTPLMMCVKYHDDFDQRKCENEAVAKGYYNSATLEVDMYMGTKDTKMKVLTR